MSTYTATIRWSRNGADGFARGQFSRALTPVTLSSVCRLSPGHPSP